MIGVTENLAKIQRFVDDAAREAGRDPAGIGIVAVSKRQSIGKIREALRAGQRAFGENFLQEAVGKIETLDDPAIEWHFIGAMQSNKTRAIAERFAWVHTVDRPKIAERLNRQRPHYAPRLNVCLQLNVDDEAQKAGIDPEDAARLAGVVAAQPRLALRGLMCIPKPATDLAEQRRPFARLRRCLEALNAEGFGMDTLSMGMSADLRAAILEGATLVRIGTAIFGERPDPVTDS